MNKTSAENEYTIGELSNSLITSQYASKFKTVGFGLLEFDLVEQARYGGSLNIIVETERDREPHPSLDFWKNFIKFEVSKVDDAHHWNEIGLITKWNENLPVYAKKIISNLSNLIPSYLAKILSQPELNLQHKKLVSFHPHKDIVAVLGSLDYIFIFALTNYNSPGSLPESILAHKFQRHVSSIQFRPHSANDLAVACSDGICLWKIRSFKPESNEVPSEKIPNITMKFLKNFTYNPVTTLSWSPCGRFLASASVNGPTITIWDCAYGIGLPVSKGFQGIVSLEWSSCGKFLFSLTQKGSLFVWDTVSWNSLRYISKSQSIPYSIQYISSWDSLSVIYKNKKEILALSIKSMESIGSKFRLPFNISDEASQPNFSLPSTSSSSPSHLLSNGPSSPDPAKFLPNILSPYDIELASVDPSGFRLAIYFKPTNRQIQDLDEKNELFGLISIFQLRLNGNRIRHIGFIKSKFKGVFPLSFGFSNTFPSGALLGVLWSNGYFHCYPLIFDHE